MVVLATLDFLALILAGAIAQSASELEERGFAALRQSRYREALEAFENLIAREPLHPSAHYGKGVARSGLLDYSAAVECFERAVALDPGYAAAFRQLAIHFAQLGKRDRARTAYEKAQSLGPAPEQVRLLLARALRKAGLVEEAHSVLASGSAPLSPQEYLELGILAQEASDHRKAAEYLSLATANPSTSSAEAEYRYGQTLEELGRPEQAAEHYRLAIERKPTLQAARFRLGNVLLRLGRREEGLALLGGHEQFRLWERKVQLLLAMVSSGLLEEKERRRRSLELIDLLTEGGALDEAEPLIQAGLARNPEDPVFRLELAELLYLRGSFAEAREVLRSPVSLPEPSPAALRLSGLLYLEEGQLTGAVQAYTRALQLAPSPSAQLLKEAGTVYAMNGQVEQAEACFRKAIEKDPSRAVIHADLGMLLESVGRKEEAEERYRRALEMDPGLVSAQQGLASLHLERGQIEEAVELFRDSVRLRPQDPVLRLNLALALEKAGKKEEAEAERDLAGQMESRVKLKKE